MMLRRGFARSCVAVTVLCGGITISGAIAGGCGSGDDSNGGSVTDSGGTSPDGGLGIIAQNVSAYVGTTATIDASQSTRPDGTNPLAYSWTLTGQPATSKLSTASIVGASTETPSIVPDVAGDYTLHGVATTEGFSNEADVKVTGVNGDVYYVQLNTHDLPPTAQIQTVQMDGTQNHALDCKRNIIPADVFNKIGGDAGPDAAVDSLSQLLSPDGGDAGPLPGLMLGTVFSAFLSPIIDVTLDTYESPTAGQPSLVAFGDFVSALGADGGAIALVVANTTNTCANPPHPVRLVTAQGSNPNVWQPRFSPDGSRVAFVEDRGSPDGGSSNTFEYISTVGADGSGPHTLASICPVATDSCWGDHLFPRRPQWQDPTHVAWLRNVSGATATSHPLSWELVSAEDAEGSTPTRLMTCSSYGLPYSFAFVSGQNFPANAILANYQASQTSAEDLVILAPDASGQCQVFSNLTNLPGGSKVSYARDFAISPDGKLVAFMMHSSERQDAGTVNAIDGGPQLDLNAAISGGGEIWLVPLDGSQPAAPLNTDRRQAYYGPRFISGGTHLAWNGQGPLPQELLDLWEAGADGGLPFSTDPEAGAQGQLASLYFAGTPAMLVAPVAGGNTVVAAQADLDTGAFPLGGGNGGGCQCTPECGLYCPPSSTLGSGNCGSCDVSRRNAPALPLATTAGILGVLFLRRRSRPKKK